MGVATGMLAEEVRPAYGANRGGDRPRRWMVREVRAPESPGEGVCPHERQAPEAARAVDGGDPGTEPDPGAEPDLGAGRADPAAPDDVDPFQDADALEELGERITTLAAHLAAAECRFLQLLAEFDRRRGWELEGHRSCAHWLSFRTGRDLRTAREKVRVAAALERLPAVGEAMGKGELSFSKVRALVRLEELLAADGEAEREMVELARDLPVQDLERFVRARKKGKRDDEAAEERRRHRLRRLTVVPDDEDGGVYEVRGKLPPEVGALLQRALEAASDALFREEVSEETTEEQRRADALGLLAEWALSAGLGADGSREPRDESGEGECAGGADRAPTDSGASTGSDGSYEPYSGPGEMDPAPGDACWAGDEPRCSREPRPASEPRPPVSGIRAERYQVLLHLDPDTLAPDREPGRSNLEDGTRLAAETARRLTCDSSVVRVLRGTEGEVLDVGRKTRTVPPALRRALEIRDRGCRFAALRAASRSHTGVLCLEGARDGFRAAASGSPTPITSSTGARAGRRA